MTKRTAISIPDDLYQRIERARKRAGKDRSSWLQEAASEYLKKRTRDEEVEDYFRGYERAPLTADEVSLVRWNEEHFGEVLDEPTTATKRKR
jgi:predicted DNA-binding protein